MSVSCRKMHVVSMRCVAIQKAHSSVVVIVVILSKKMGTAQVHWGWFPSRKIGIGSDFEQFLVRFSPFDGCERVNQLQMFR